MATRILPTTSSALSGGSQTHIALSKITTHNDALEQDQQDHISDLNKYDNKTIKREVVTMIEH